MDPWLTAFGVLAVVAELTVRGLVAVRVVMRRRPVGEALAWLLLVLLVPLAGAVLYLVVGEIRLGSRRARRARDLETVRTGVIERIAEGREPDWDGRHRDAEELARLAACTLRVPALDGNRLELLSEAEPAFRRLIDDIEKARTSVDLEYYIWSPGGVIDEVAAAVARAARRGVRCRILVDAIGSRGFLGGPWPSRLREAGAEVVAALPAGLVRALAVRIDVRNHRKIAVIDGAVAHTGSLNLADPAVFKQDGGWGPWVDATVRLRGPAVEVLAAVFEVDWHLETGEPVPEGGGRQDAVGRSPVQVLPSGPGGAPHAIQQVVLTAIYAASDELVLSTPYFVPDDATLRALASAALGGVRVVLVVPARIDHPLVALACRSSFGELLEAGVEIHRFDGGLLHAKTIVVDRGLAFIGSLNMDMRSFWLNFEVTLAVYDREFAGELRALQESYLADATRIEAGAWRRRPATRRLVENAVRLASPVL